MEKRLITSLVGAAMLMAASPALAERNLALSVHSSTVAATQQQRTVTGTVVDAQGEPLIGVTVKEQGTQNAAVTDMDGRFKLQLSKSDAQVVFTYIGYVDVTARATDNMVVTMKEDRNELNEIVVVGYGTQKKVNLTGAVTAVESKELENRASHNLTNMLQGQVPGLNITTSKGQPGAAGSLNIRGYTSINGGDPLVLVDGVESDMSMVNPNDVESISVIKDASAAAVYGTRGAWGVILITTKSGKDEEGNAVVTYSGRMGQI